MNLKGAEIVIETLIELGVTDIFGYPGGAVLDIYDAIYARQDRIKHHITAHEQGAAHAADGYFRATGKVGVVLATSGPGATNLVTGIATAMMDSVPLVAITGNVAQSLIGRDSFQEIDITGITLPITKHNFFIHKVEKLADKIREAFRIARSGRPGPVLIDIPKDIQIALCEYMPKPIEPLFPIKSPDKQLVESAAKLLNQKSRPYIHVGGGVIGSHARDLVLELADRVDGVIGCSFMGISAIDSDHPRFLGMQGMHGHYASSAACSEADVIIAIGTRFSDRATGNKAKFAANSSIIHIDADQSEIGKNIPTDIGICGNITESISGILASLEQHDNKAWIERVDELRARERKYSPKADSLNPYFVMNEINAVKDADTVIATDVGQHQMWAAQYLKFSKERTFASSGGLGTMGFGLGAAIGAAVGTKHPTILVTGDGSFGMNLNELSTAVRENVPLTIVIMDNGVLGMVRQWQTLFYKKHYSNTTLAGTPDYVKLAEAFGAKGVRTATCDEFSSALREAYSSEGVTVIDCLIDKDEFVLPMLPPGGAVEDIIVEKEV
ncbi:MAG: biosynthetic-type acetolactate synthase large subunit [Oscillospiraceae bacterium]|nr:biosynthetic-type acetolactate synthase large subunit [Oscillospiraceae bacterium]